MPHSLTYSLLLAEKAHAFTRGHLSGHQGEKVTTEAEAAESKKAKDKVRTDRFVFFFFKKKPYIP